jgi:hypothetical protein
MPTTDDNKPDDAEGYSFQARLERWAYAVNQLYQTPAADLIEHHATYLLSRALNIGRLTAFIGSGASMAYGRISWSELIRTAQERVLLDWKGLDLGKGHKQQRISELKQLLDNAVIVAARELSHKLSGFTNVSNS